MLRLTPVVKNLVILNVVVFILQYVMQRVDITGILALWSIGSENFRPYQFFTYSFAHGDFFHILFNMMALVFLGPMLEQRWGSKQFLLFYMITAIGASMLYGSVQQWRNGSLERDVTAYVMDPTPDHFLHFVDKHRNYLPQDAYDISNTFSKNPGNELYIKHTIAMVEGVYERATNFSYMLGASGAVYGILLAFGLLFPNLELMLIFPPIPVKAKYMVMVLGGIALYSGLSRQGDGVAHLTHLGGMIFSFIMIRFWLEKR